jgi:hypothetical protein
LGLVIPVSAIVVEDYAAAEAPPPDLDWNYVYNYKGSSSVAVGGGWLLTAGHVADDGGSGSISADGTVYQQQEIVMHPSADLALVRYDKAFPGSYELYTGNLPLTFEHDKLPVYMVGYGVTGDVYSDYWSRNGSGRGTRRWGSQEIDIALDDEFWMYFDEGHTTYEAGAGDGDSGGGVFYMEGDTWKLAGINVAIKSKPGTSGLGFDRTVAVSMPYYADWVMDTIPEPAAVGLVGFGALGLFLSRAKGRRRAPVRSLFRGRGHEPLCDRFRAGDEGEQPPAGW